MIKYIIETKLIEPLWVMYIDGKQYTGSSIQKNKTCTPDCFNIGTSAIHECEHNYSHITKTINDQKITISELFIPNEKTPKHIRKNPEYKRRRTTYESVKTWTNKLEEKVSSIELIIEEHAKSRLDPFHEFVKWANEIKHFSDRLINKKGFSDSPEDLKSLHKTTIMLMDSLDTTAIYVNPESAIFGRKRATDIYKLVDKIKMILSHSKGNKNRININIKGRVINTHKVYESFKIIPTCLIQNAIKYRKNSDIEIIFNEQNKILDFCVSSIGDHISDQEITDIFKRGYRTEKAKKMKVEGSGLGLYALKIVADFHEFQVSVSSTPLEGSDYAKNSFTVKIH